MNLSNSIKFINTELVKNSPAILVFLGVTGLVTAGVMACKATTEAVEVLDDLHEEEYEDEEEEDIKAVKIAKDVKAVAPLYVPAVLMAGLSITCIVLSYSITNKRMAALATAYGISERTLREYQKKVIDTIGEKKEERIRDEIKKDKVRNTPPSSNDLISPSEGNMLCYDSVLGGYFQSNINKIRKIESRLNHRMRSEMYISVNDFFDELGRAQIKHGNDLGWNVDHEINITFSSIITEEDRTCLVIDYDICPRHDFRSLY